MNLATLAGMAPYVVGFVVGAVVDPLDRFRAWQGLRRARASCRLCGGAKGEARKAFVLCQACADGFAAEGGACGEDEGWPKETA